MPFNEVQKEQFIALLKAKGWQLRDDTVWSPSGALWFSNAHFEDWSPARMHDIFAARSIRIAKARIGDWQRASRENKEASRAAEDVGEI